MQSWGCLGPMLLPHARLALPAPLQPLGYGCVLPGGAPVPPAPVGASARPCWALSCAGAACPSARACPGPACCQGSGDMAVPALVRGTAGSECCQCSACVVTPGPQSSWPQPALHSLEGGGAGPWAVILLGKGRWKPGSQQLISVCTVTSAKVVLSGASWINSPFLVRAPESNLGEDFAVALQQRKGDFLCLFRHRYG